MAEWDYEKDREQVSKLLRLRWRTMCSECGRALEPRTQAWWDPSSKRASCTDCRPIEPSLSGTRPNNPLLDTGVAGASAQETFDRLHERRQKEIERRWGRFAGLVKFLSDDPQSIRVWAQGSKGERILAEHMTKALGDTAVLLNDRRVPNTSGNIDHIAVASSGVWVIDTKRWDGLVELRDVGGWFRTDYRLYVKGQDRTKTVRNMSWQIDAVKSALAETGIDAPLHAALCFVEAEWRLFAKPFTLQGVRVSGPKSLAAIIAENGPLDRDRVMAVASRLADALPSKA
jgi:hypothetical protein